LERLSGEAARHYRKALDAGPVERLEALRDAQDATDAGSNFGAYKLLQEEIADASEAVTQAPRELHSKIAADQDASARVLNYLDRLGVAHSGEISGATLGKVCGVDSRTWRKWVGGERGMPLAAWRLLIEVSGVTK
jgi:hypothetical protein